MVGDTVTFRCEYTGTRDLPRWRIGGADYSVIDLLPGHRYTFGGLQVQSVQASLNNTEYRCFFLSYFSGQFHRVESLPAYLVIRSFGMLMLVCICSPVIHDTIASKFLYIVSVVSCMCAKANL